MSEFLMSEFLMSGSLLYAYIHKYAQTPESPNINSPRDGLHPRVVLREQQDPRPQQGHQRLQVEGPRLPGETRRDVGQAPTAGKQAAHVLGRGR